MIGSGSIAVNSFGSTSPFAVTTTLTAGRHLDFVLVTQQFCCNLSTGLDLTITSPGNAAPEPGGIGLALT